MSSSSDETPCKNQNIFENLDDRISNLPDDIIGEILSRLRTKDALRTSVLSRTWKYKWKSTYNVNIEDFGVASGDMITWILVRTLSCRIKRFRLYCQRLYDPCDLKTWISWVFKHKLESVNINVYFLTERLDSKWGFSNWASLTELELCLSCTLVHPVNSCFPNLKKLILAHGFFGNIKIKVEQISSEGGIIVNFPVLEVLVLKGCEWMDVNFVEIHAPKLIKFEIMLSSSNNFYLHTPLVSCVEFSDPVPKKIILPQRYHDILKQLPGITCLKLSKLAVQDLLPSQSGLVFPTFDRLKELQLCDGYCIRNVLELLQLLPTLELLKLNILDWYSNHGIGQPWPRKIVSNLKKVELYNFNGSNLQMDFTKLVLKNASKLKQMSVFICYYMTVKKANNMLSKLIPKSSSCQLVVSEQFEFH